jgi:ABC-type multidrug transport system fused ATPase/permease subunit
MIGDDIVFLSFSKTIAKFGGFRLGVGMRVNKKNSAWIAFLIFFVVMFQLMWYMLLLCFWLMYAMLYFLYWCARMIVRALSKSKKENKNDVNINYGGDQ